MVIAYGSVNTSYAISTGWKNATELGIGGGTVTTDAITSVNDEKWYKFTTTSENEVFYVTLYDMPSANAYNVELRYQEEQNKRPIIMENKMQKSANGKLHIRKILENIGTYYIRVYSLTGEYSDEPYTLNISSSSSGMSVSINSVNPSEGVYYDWAACAEIIGKAYYKFVYDTDLTSRDYHNAAAFVQKNGEKDTASSATAKRGTLDDTLQAVNYIFDGDYSQNPVFKITDEIKTATDFRKYMWFTNKYRNNMPILVRLVYGDFTDMDDFARYVIIKGYDLEYNELSVFDPDSTASGLYVDADDFTFSANSNLNYKNEAIVLK